MTGPEVISKTQNIFVLPKPIQSVHSVQRFATKFSEVTRNTLKICVQFTDRIPQSIQNPINATKILAAFDILMSLPKVINEGYTAVRAERSIDRVAHAWQSIFCLSSIILNTRDVVKALKVYTIIAKDACSWLDVAGKFLYPFLVVNFINSTYEFARFEDFYRDLRQNVRVLGPKAEGLRRVEVLTEACQYVQKNQNRIEKLLSIDAAAKIDLRAQAILKQIGNNEVDLDAAELFVKTLRNRAHLQLGFEISSLALKAATVVMVPLSLFVAPIPEILIISVAVSVVKLAHLGLSAVVLTRDPFSESKLSISFSKYQGRKTANIIKTFMQELKQKLKMHVQHARAFVLHYPEKACRRLF